jgi:hypothetical protein
VAHPVHILTNSPHKAVMRYLICSSGVEPEGRRSGRGKFEFLITIGRQQRESQMLFAHRLLQSS